ncbi:hypothetical protein [Actinotignum timonense]|uniref:hypothetical protein n=1 Tax=Actinotignum timonense TaxID=1870995 RepID=UPI002A808B3B|nr:hypothetical protein [Actinotignum timonense]MDY5156586.1 hypothetical protein [Actinotignum timonense]
MNTAQNLAPDLVANNLTKNFGSVAALRQVSLRIPGGQSVAIMGPSGLRTVYWTLSLKTA